MTDSQVLCDVQLQVGGQLFQAHRLVLSACSPYFDALLTSGLSETHQDVINIQGVQPNIFELLLKFIYTGLLDVTTNNAQGLLVAADMFQLTEIKEISASFFKLQLHSSNCLGFLRLSQALSCPELSTASRAYIHSKISEVKGEEEFFDLDVETLIEILQSEDLRVDYEYEVFEAAMNWISHDPPNRRKHLVRVLEPVRIPIIQPAQLFKYIEECKDLSLRIATGKLLQDYNPRRKSQASSKVSHAKSQLPLKYYQPRKNSKKRLIVMGGYYDYTTTLGNVQLYDSFDQTWHPFPAMQQSRSRCGAAVLGGTVYAIGGLHGNLILQNVEKFDAVENCWIKMSPLLSPRNAHRVCVVENKIYVFGGWVVVGEQEDGIFYKETGLDIERYDPEDDVWTVHDRLAVCRIKCGVVSHEGLVYLAGGTSDTGTQLRLVESYNPVIKEWTQLASMLTLRSQFAMAVLDNALYVIGGINSSMNKVSSVERYSILENRWMEVKSMIMPRSCAGVAVAHGKLYVVGGEGSETALLDTMECYDPETDIWIDLGQMPVGRSDAAVAVL